MGLLRGPVAVSGGPKAAPAGEKGQGDKSKGGKGMVEGKPSSKDKGKEGEEGNGEGKAVTPEIVD